MYTYIYVYSYICRFRHSTSATCTFGSCNKNAVKLCFAADRRGIYSNYFFASVSLAGNLFHCYSLYKASERSKGKYYFWYAYIYYMVSTMLYIYLIISNFYGPCGHLRPPLLISRFLTQIQVRPFYTFISWPALNVILIGNWIFLKCYERLASLWCKLGREKWSNCKRMQMHWQAAHNYASCQQFMQRAQNENEKAVKSANWQLGNGQRAMDKWTNGQMAIGNWCPRCIGRTCCEARINGRCFDSFLQFG